MAVAHIGNKGVGLLRHGLLATLISSTALQQSALLQPIKWKWTTDLISKHARKAQPFACRRLTALNCSEGKCYDILRRPNTLFFVKRDVFTIRWLVGDSFCRHRAVCSPVGEEGHVHMALIFSAEVPASALSPWGLPVYFQCKSQHFFSFH